MTLTVETTLTGIHSRSEDSVRVSRDFERGRATKELLDRTFQEDAANLVKLQEDSNIDRISDGQLLWQDFLRPFSENFGGLKGGADLSRWFDTNSFFRKPTVMKKLKSPNETDFVKNYEILSALTLASENRKKKISIPGPYTLASLVDDQKYGSKEDLIDDFAKLLRKLLKSLKAIGFQSVQINEPSLVFRYGTSALTSKKELKAFLSAFDDHFKSPPVEISLHTYFGDCSPILDRLLDLESVSEIGIDFTQTSLDSIEKTDFGDKTLACGCVDGRSSLVESPEWIAEYCEEAIRSLNPAGLGILPSSELKYLPRTYADEKIRAIGKASEIVRKRVN